MKTHDRIIKNIGKHLSLDRAEAAYFVNLLKQEKPARKDFVLREGQRCKNIFYVNTGILRAYYVDKTGRESTIMFAAADWWITDMYSFINKLPSMLYIEAVADSNILTLQKDDLDKLYLELPKFERFFRIIMQNAYIREQLRVIQNLSLSAAERYYNFLTKYPEIAKQVTQKQIASYLGITPEFLSAIRGNKSKKLIS